MTQLVTAFAVSLAVLFFLSCYLVLWASRFAWARWTVVGSILVAALVAASGYAVFVGRPAMLSFYRFFERGEVELFGARIEEPGRILLAVVGSEGPVLLSLPFERNLAEQLQEAQKRAAKQGGTVRMRLSELAERRRQGGGPEEDRPRDGTAAETEKNPFFVYGWHPNLPSKE